MKFRLGPMHSELWPWTKIEGRWHVRSWFIFRLCQVFPGRTFWGHSYGRKAADDVVFHSGPTRDSLAEFLDAHNTGKGQDS